MADSRRLPPQVGPPFGGDSTAARYVGAVGVLAFGVGYISIRPVGGGGIRPLLPEHQSPIHLNLYDIGDISRVVASAGRMGSMAMVEVGGFIFRSVGYEGI